MKNDTLYENVIMAINKLFFDDSVSQEVARLNLENLKEEIDLLIETLETENFPE